MDIEKKPQYAVCDDCNREHEWIIAYLPIELTAFANICKDARCPKCGGKKIFLKKELQEKPVKKSTTCYYAEDGTLMSSDGTRSIFDDVDQ